MTTTKSDIATRLALAHDLSQAKAEGLVADVLDAIAIALRNGHEVRLHGFGIFAVAERKASTGRNPRTGEAIEIAAGRKVRFRVARRLAATVNG